MIALHANSEIDLYNKLYTYIQKQYAGEKPCNDELKRYFKMLQLRAYCNNDSFCGICVDNCSTTELVGCTVVSQDSNNSLRLILTGNNPFNYVITGSDNCFSCSNLTGTATLKTGYSEILLNINSLIEDCFVDNLFTINITDITGCTTTAYFYINTCDVFSFNERDEEISIESNTSGIYFTYSLTYTPAISENIVSYLWTSNNSNLPLLTNNTNSTTAISQSGAPCSHNVTFTLELTNKENCKITKTLTLNPTC